MKGLLLKDWYALKSYCRTFLILVLVYAAVSPAYGGSSGFVILFPCVLSGMISMTLIAYEEREKWNVYAATLPVSKAQQVSCKYLVSLIVSSTVLCIILLSHTAAALAKHSFDLTAIGSLLTILVPLCLLPTALLLPFIFWLGAEKGRMMYYGIFVFYGLAITFISPEKALRVTGKITVPVILAVPVLLFGASWLLSIRLYQKREL